MRYLGSKCKRCRAVGASVCGRAKCALSRRTNPPGQHGGERKKRSEHGQQLLEKQKIRWTYDISEKQFYKIFEVATKAKGVTGTVLLQLLESRLDNIVFRSGLATSRGQARQLVSHGHLLVNGRKAAIPSMRLRPGDVVSVKEASNALVKEAKADWHIKPDWLTVDAKAMTATYTMLPEREQLDQSFRENLVIEYYSR
ncbi:MAG: 30S ribosomal protein S4 [Candidatus Obscuribacterales bacterium]|jgi:small subunit ribosomal protein S4|nr:30S ribosomal protein S4 [Candidatus Obscuribacterales bacterium]